MKRFNIANSIYFYIKEEGWEYIERTKGKEYIERYIKPYSKTINGKVYYRWSCWRLFCEFPYTFNELSPFDFEILIDDERLEDVIVEESKAVEFCKEIGLEADGRGNFIYTSTVGNSTLNLPRILEDYVENLAEKGLINIIK